MYTLRAALISNIKTQCEYLVSTQYNCSNQGWCKQSLCFSASTQAQRCALDKSNMPLSHLSQTKWPALCYHRWAQRAEVLAQVNCQGSLLLPGEMWHWWLSREAISQSLLLFCFSLLHHSGSVTETRLVDTSAILPSCHIKAIGLVMCADPRNILTEYGFVSKCVKPRQMHFKLIDQ